MDLSSAPFYGRQPELATMGRFLLAGQPRLIAITGPAGAGKSRLAREAVTTYATLFDEVCFLALNQIDPDRAAFTAARAASGGGLLVLDGLDDAPDGGGSWMEMLTVLPAARVLLTARSLTGLPGLVKLRLDGLPIPPRDQKTGLACSASVALFVAAVRQGHPGYRPDPADLERIAACCRAASGLPGEVIRGARAFRPHAVSA